MIHKYISYSSEEMIFLAFLAECMLHHVPRPVFSLRIHYSEYNIANNILHSSYETRCNKYLNQSCKSFNGYGYHLIEEIFKIKLYKRHIYKVNVVGSFFLSYLFKYIVMILYYILNLQFYLYFILAQLIKIILSRCIAMNDSF